VWKGVASKSIADILVLARHDRRSDFLPSLAGKVLHSVRASRCIFNSTRVLEVVLTVWATVDGRRWSGDACKNCIAGAIVDLVAEMSLLRANTLSIGGTIPSPVPPVIEIGSPLRM
jgi:hypothetical protein